MNGRSYGIAILLSLSVGAGGRVSAQEPAVTATFQPKAGQAVFVVAVRGDCGRSGLATVNGSGRCRGGALIRPRPFPEAYRSRICLPLPASREGGRLPLLVDTAAPAMCPPKMWLKDS